MREIKFRAWDKKSKRMTTAQEFFLPASIVPVGMTWDTHEIMQFTGIKDKNGKEIYEGDIVNEICEDCETIECGEVIFSDGVFGWKNGDGAMIFQQDDFDYKVIGNIYENPELLKYDTA